MLSSPATSGLGGGTFSNKLFPSGVVPCPAEKHLAVSQANLLWLHKSGTQTVPHHAHCAGDDGLK